jgi:hypothetical protein
MRISRILATLVVLTGMPGMAPAEPAVAGDPAAMQADSSARRAVRDKESGELRAPTAEEMKAMRELPVASRANKQPLQLRQHPDGMRSAVPGPDYMVTLRGQRQANGSVVSMHGDTPAGERTPTPAAQRPTE